VDGLYIEPLLRLDLGETHVLLGRGFVDGFSSHQETARFGSLVLILVGNTCCVSRLAIQAADRLTISSA
jgi:hypothetical protein